MSLITSLYKYCSFNEYTEASLRENYIWMSKCSDFNDPFEFTLNSCLGFQDSEPNIRPLVSQVIKDMHSHEVYSNKKNRDKDLNKLEKMTIKKVRKYVSTLKNMFSYVCTETIDKAKCDLRVFCASRTNDNPLMWGHYGNGLRGLCIEYDTNYLSGGLIEVKYTSAPPVLKPADLSSPRNINSQLICQLLYGYKQECWSYEQEIRIALQVEKLQNYSNKLQLPPNTIKSITIGSLMPEVEQQKVISIAKSLSVPYKFAEPIPKTYEINITKPK